MRGSEVGGGPRSRCGTEAAGSGGVAARRSSGCSGGSQPVRQRALARSAMVSVAAQK